MVDLKKDEKMKEKQANWKKIHNHYLDKRSEKMKKTQFEVEVIYGDISSKDSISPQKITQPNVFSGKTL